MLLVLPIALLLVSAFLMAVLRQVRPQFGYFWLVAALAALLAWPLVFLQRWRLPWALPLTTWVRLIVWFVIGLVVYFSYGIRRSKLAKPAAGGRS